MCVQVDETKVLFCGGFREEAVEGEEAITDMYILDLETNIITCMKDDDTIMKLKYPDFFFANQYTLDWQRQTICAIGESHIHYIDISGQIKKIKCSRFK